jgi:uncharacterized membrane protein YdcZ (DUF606 family)
MRTMLALAALVVSPIGLTAQGVPNADLANRVKTIDVPATTSVTAGAVL